MQNVNKEYKKCDDKALDKVNKEDKDIAENLDLDNRMYAFSKHNAFLTVKDHKPNFMNNTTYKPWLKWFGKSKQKHPVKDSDIIEREDKVKPMEELIFCDWLVQETK